MQISRTAPPLAGPVVAAQEWRDVTFAHWRIPPDDVAPLLPEGVVPDVFDGSSWVGLIAFELGEARVGPFPPSPVGSRFTEVNVRLYGVDETGRRGVVFRSLEASSLPAVLAARALFSLPYLWARTAQYARDGGWDYASRRISARPGQTGPGFQLSASVDTSTVVDDELTHFLTARWGLFQSRFGRTQWLPNAHEPWIIHPARIDHLRDDLVAAAGLAGVTQRAPDSVLYSEGVTSRFGLGEWLGSARRGAGWSEAAQRP
ncbi:YqjF family protein [Microbacterium rhizomatis]|uniref:DUF2071 domain-containing protein n=1 Tax=Microbacterium rhizomatis TaxID=1631477 RepID=A0A5J5IXN1_9MICO|nr:DUF2071 domain-containing protein [Microbacterium rhizomatis]KAA9106422.1 DUF2071 domain-containing protein [Microbacterium rhizomatis]